MIKVMKPKRPNLNLKALAKQTIDRKLRRSVTRLLQNHHPTIVAVTGSVGKTSAKNAISHVLSDSHRVNSDLGSYNTEIGLPLSFFGLKAPTRLTNPLEWKKVFKKINQTIDSGYPYDMSVLEMGADRPGEIGYFLGFIKPSIAVITGIAAVHTQGFGTVEAILAEKWLLAEQSDRVVYNADFELLRQRAKSLASSKLIRSYGLDHGEVTFADLRRNAEGYFEGQLKLGSTNTFIATQMVARTGLYSLLAAACVADMLEVTLGDIIKSLGEIAPTKGRMRLLKGVNQSQILDDSYNSSPISALSALQTLADFPAGQRIAILGSMNELGDHATQGHVEVGTKAGQVVDLLITIGDEAKTHLAPAAIAAGLSIDKVKCFEGPRDAGIYVRPLIKKDDAVLVKGSQNRVFTEEAIKVILASDLDPAEQLVRQSVDWLRVKKDYL